MTIGRINFASLETLCLIGRTGTFTGAAESLHTTQPAISARMRDLEMLLGVPLFRKAGNRLVLTPTAKALVHQLEPLLHEIVVVVQQATEPSQMRGRIRFGLSSMYMGWVPRLLGRIKQQLPLVTFDLQIDRAEALVLALMAGDLDIVFLAGNFSAPGFKVLPITQTRLEWMISSKLPFSKNSTDGERLLSQPIWCVSAPSHSHAATKRSLSEHNLHADLNMVSSMSGVIDVVRAGAGIGMLPLNMLKDGNSGLRRLSATLPILPLDVHLVYPLQGADPVFQRLLEVFMKPGSVEAEFIEIDQSM